MCDELIIPPGMATGCLPRVTKFGECCAPMADKIKVIDRDDWGDFIGQVSCRQYVTQILDQNGFGSCATCSTSQGLMVVRAAAGLDFVLLNPLSIYRVTSGGSDRGSNIDRNLEFARDKGVLPESYWPYSKGFRAKPPDGWEGEAANFKIDEFWDIGSVEEVGTALLYGLPVVFGWKGHSCVLVELTGENEAIYANSWGKAWSDQGFGKIKLSAINFGYGAFAVRTPTQADDDLMPPIPRAA